MINERFDLLTVKLDALGLDKKISVSGSVGGQWTITTNDTTYLGWSIEEALGHVEDWIDNEQTTKVARIGAQLDSLAAAWPTTPTLAARK
jgi:hypothetical protein